MTWKRTTETLLRSVAPDDLADRPVYLLSASDCKSVDPRLWCDRHAGWTSAICDLLFAELLIDRGEWRGRGCAIVIDGETLTGQQLAGVALHELGHWITYRNSAESVGELDPTGHESKYAQAALEILNDWRLSEDDDDEPAKPWASHESNFVRACCHLAHRVASVLESVRPSHLVFGQQYFGGTFTESTWMATLADELGTPGPIADIITTDPPQSFSDCYAMATGWADR